MKNNIELKTERLILRPMKKADAALVIKWRNSPELKSLFDSSRSHDIALEEHLTWFASTRKNRLDFIVCDRLSLTPFAVVGFEYLDLSNKLIGIINKYIGEKEFYGKGFASEFTEKLLDYGFSSGLEYAYSKTKKDNLVNINLNQKFGFNLCNSPFKKEKLDNSWTYMKLSLEDWNIKNKI